MPTLNSIRAQTMRAQAEKLRKSGDKQAAADLEARAKLLEDADKFKQTQNG